MVWKKATPLGYQLHLIVQFHLLRKCGLLAHTSAAFLKNCCTEKLFSCLRLVIENTPLRKNGLSRPTKGGSTPAFVYQRAAIAPETLYLITTS